MIKKGQTRENERESLKKKVQKIAFLVNIYTPRIRQRRQELSQKKRLVRSLQSST